MTSSQNGLEKRFQSRKGFNDDPDLLLAHIGGVGPLAHGVDGADLADLEQVTQKIVKLLIFTFK